MLNQDSIRQEWYDFKLKQIEKWIGKKRDTTFHSIIPYTAGGPLDEYYFDYRESGTAMVTMELTETPDTGPGNSIFERYELAICSRCIFQPEQSLSVFQKKNPESSRLFLILNYLAPYCSHATIERFETCEFPNEIEKIGGTCLVFDAILKSNAPEKFGIMLPIVVSRSEMDYARTHGGEKLIEILKYEGHFPFSGLNRSPVV